MDQKKLTRKKLQKNALEQDISLSVYLETKKDWKFVDFYESKGWMIGKNKMKNWKASIRTWKSKQNNQDAKQEDDSWKHE